MIPRPVPWKKQFTLEQVLERIEDRAMKLGWHGVRSDEGAIDVDAAEKAAGAPIPPQIRTLCEWYDQGMWHRAFNPDDIRKSDHPAGIYRIDGTRIEAGDPDDRPVVPIDLDAPELIQPPHDPEDNHYLLEAIEGEGFPREWKQLPIWRFAWSDYWARAYFCENPPIGHAPVLCEVEQDFPQMVHASTDLPTWLARITSIGFEPVFHRGGLADIPRNWSRYIREEYRWLNPHWTDWNRFWGIE